jgi:hypothetical protein
MMTRREMSAALGASLVALLSEAAAGIRADAAVPRWNLQEPTPLGAPRGIPTLMQESIGDIGDAEVSVLILNIPASPLRVGTARSRCTNTQGPYSRTYSKAASKIRSTRTSRKATTPVIIGMSQRCTFIACFEI